MYEFYPKQTGTAARGLILLFFIGAGALMLITMLFPTVPFRWAFQLIALGLLTAAVFLVTRYVTKRFLYRIEQAEDGSADLTVIELSSAGKRRLTVCRIGLHNVQKAELLCDPVAVRDQFSLLKRERIKLFDYTVDFHPAESIFLLVDEGGERLAIRLSYDEALWALLTPNDASAQNPS